MAVLPAAKQTKYNLWKYAQLNGSIESCEMNELRIRICLKICAAFDTIAQFHNGCHFQTNVNPMNMLN